MSNPDSASPTDHCFRVHAAADAGMLLRVIELFAKRALVPERVECRSSGAALAIEIEAASLEAAVAAQIARGLGAVVGVERVALASRPIVSNAAAA